jgi:tRNA A-37 threonylcarbamoyl transferase component Bud32
VAASEAYCLTDPLFFDSPIANRGADDRDFPRAQSEPPAGWERVELEDWLMYAPTGCRLPPQGWKIHASSCLDHADEVLEIVWGYCVERNIPFKFIRSELQLFLRNAKYSHRGSSGKFVTIYPADDAQFERILKTLAPLLEGFTGPYILSDLRWDKGPLYVRYGGFAERYCIGGKGEQSLAIEDGDGRLVEDRRGAVFEIPDWVTPPSCLTPHIEARNSTTIEEMPYLIESAVHFSNGGGLYLGTDKGTGEKVVLKEARPHAGLTADRADAVTRLGRERAALERLHGLDVVPSLRDYFTLAEHHFLVEEYVEGKSLNSEVGRRYPLGYEGTDVSARATYASWALQMQRRVEEAVDEIHGRGMVLGDVHPSNVLVRPDGRVVLIDFEVASEALDELHPTLADPGFMPPAHATGADVDRYALACMRLFLFLPLTSLVVLDSRKARQLAEVIAELFPVPREFLDEAVQVIEGAHAAAASSSASSNGASPDPPVLDRDPAGWRTAVDSMGEAILASATPARDDRLFPGAVEQFSLGGLNLAYGAAGVLYALEACGHGRYPSYEDWLVERATNPKAGTRLGFYDGLHGVAYALDRLERRADALRVLDICLDEAQGKWDHFGLSLFGGLGGMALNLAHFAQTLGDATFLDTAMGMADVVASKLGEEDDVAEISGGEHPYAGLTRGSSGAALMFIRLFEQSGDEGLLDLAATALRQDLRRCVVTKDESLEVNEGWRTMPYLADGSIGIGFVLDEYLAHRQDERFADAAAAIRTAAEAMFYIEPGLFYGRAGMMLYLARRPSGAAADDERAADHVARLTWHAMTYRGRIAFPGEHLLKLSMDLATGTAGVMLAVGAVLREEHAHLPFLAPRAEDLASTRVKVESTSGRG